MEKLMKTGKDAAKTYTKCKMYIQRLLVRGLSKTIKERSIYLHPVYERLNDRWLIDVYDYDVDIDVLYQVDLKAMSKIIESGKKIQVKDLLENKVESLDIPF